MSTLQEIKVRIGAVGTIKKITKAMQLVAASKLLKTKGNLDDIKEYYEEVFTTFSNLLGSIKDFDKIVKTSNSNKDLYILITSDLGLCGSYNSGVIKLLKTKMSSKDEVIVVGAKGISSFKKNNSKIAEFDHVGDEPNYLISSEIAKISIAKYLAGEVKSINVVHTKYNNPVSFEPTLTKIIPFKDNEENIKKSFMEFEPDPETIILNSLPLYVSAILFGVMTESKVSEMSSRRIAMENASDNADEIMGTLGLKYNRARQAKITQEISEIVAGAEIE